MSRIFEQFNGEDLEREYLKDEMYLMEEEMRVEEECWQWEEEHQEPAEIRLVMPKVKKEQNDTV